jgi:hypothetical protein
MEISPRTIEALELLVTQEMDRLTPLAKELVRTSVRASLLPELREAIRDCVSQALEEVLAEEMARARKDGWDEEDLGSESVFSEEGEWAPEEDPPEENAGNGECAEGRYVYCIADSGADMSLGRIGIEDAEVYAIPYDEVCAVVHDCSAKPYVSEDEDKVKGWVQAHQRVLDVAMEKFGAVVPLAFDTIVRSEGNTPPDETVKEWLKNDIERLREKLDRVNGKQEFGVQILYDPAVIGKLIAQESDTIREMEAGLATQKPGTAYINRQRLEKAVKEEIEKATEERFREFYAEINNHVEDIKVEKTRRCGHETMLMNLSCLVSKEKVDALGDELEKISTTHGFSVRFTGPWAPNSFV